MSVPLLTQAYQLGLTTVLWNDEGQDWSRPGAGVIIQRIFSFARNGAIILLHDGGGDRSQTVAALPFIIVGLEEIGFHFVTIQQMVIDLGHQRSPTSSETTATAFP